MENLDSIVRVHSDSYGYIDVDYSTVITTVSAHCYNNGKYSRGMFKTFKKVMEKEKVIFTELPHDYLVSFFSRHYDTIQAEKNYYILRMYDGRFC